MIDTYAKVQNQSEVARLLNISKDAVGYILKDSDAKIKTSGEIISKRNGICVEMIDKKTNQVIKVFSNQSDAARWLINHDKTSMTNTEKISYVIGRAVRGLRKTAYGYIWRKI